MAIKGIIFDLDDTLYDCTGTVFAHITQYVSKETAKLLGLPAKKVFAAYKKILKQQPNFIKATQFLCHELGAGAKAGAACKQAETIYFSTAGIKNLKPFPGVRTMLLRLRKKYKLGLVTFGGLERQNKKIDALKLRPYFNFIGVDQYGKLELTKKECFEDFLTKYRLKAEEVIGVGDKLSNEIRIANQLGMTTVRVLHGRYAQTEPADDYEIPDYTLTKAVEVEKLVRQLNKGNNKR